MPKTLVLAEKPSVGRELARVLGCRQNGNGCLIGDKYIVTWALGHLVTLADPELYDDKYKSWRLEDLPMLPQNMKLVIIKETGKQFKAVQELMKRPDVDSLVIATDAGREGELVARWIMQKCGWKKPARRLWISSQTDKAIREGFQHLKPAREYDALYHSAVCRAEADWLVGLNVTRALSCKFNAQLTAGRVQTPTLAMIVQREQDIHRFVPKDYWTVHGQFPGFTGLWKHAKTQESRLFDRSEAEALVQKVSGKSGVLSEVTKELKKEQPPAAYDLTELQRDANKRFNYSAKQTLSIIQNLYERHKLLTYPRTDSRYITDDMAPTLPERLRAIAVGPYASLAAGLLRNNAYSTKRIIDNAKVTDHHAIIPTEQPLNLSALTAEERNVYDLAARRFIAVLSPPFEYEETRIRATVEGENFHAKGKIVRSPGWKAAYGSRPDEDSDDEDQEKEQSLPAVKKGDQVRLQSAKITAGKTKPPARYTEATLLSAMEHPGKLIEDKALKQTVETTGGLGTPATRADIIEKLFNTFYVEKRGKELIPTSKGSQLIGLAPSDLKSPLLTAQWESHLAEISHGKRDDQAFITEMRTYAARLVSMVKTSEAKYTHDNVTREKCPQCGKYLLDVNGKKGRMLVCPDRDCGYRQNISVVSNARCPNCHKKMELRGQGDKKMFACTCGYRESLAEFEKKKGAQVHKRDIERYIAGQKDDGFTNDALARQLSQLKNKMK
ncbi:MAG: DNA topoisomerase III [Peptococcaceae bacterium]|jgi:DNA topoisomerase-3|nr:DNA topoisomerase III [Peptococcaceae bacterium]